MVKKRRKNLILVIIAIIFLFLLFKIILGNFIAGLFNPSLRGINQAGIEINKDFLGQDKVVSVDDLKNQILILQKKNIDLQNELNQTNILNRQLKYVNQQTNRYVLANIIGQNNELGVDYFIIDRGSEDGINDGAAVMVNEGYLLGKIIKTEKKRSYLLPLYDNHFLTSVDFLTSDQGSNVISGLAQGRHGLGVEVNFVPIDKNIKIGDYVITSGLESNIPRGLVVGQVEDITKKTEDAFQNIKIKSLVSLKEVRIISVLANNNI